MQRFGWDRIHWRNSVFLAGTLVLTLTAAPAYLVYYGLSGFQAGLFLIFFLATGLSITLGYHRLFSHLSFTANWPVRLTTLLFGAAAFEQSALRWAADHRRHHKFVDQEEDPYDISKGFFHAHIGWLLFRPPLPESLDNVRDLERDPLVRWQDRHYFAIAIVMGFALPALIGGIWGGAVGALGGFLLAGVARLVFVHHMTFFINSLCHTIGRQPFSSRCTARNSALMAFFTFGEGYHNFHHEFQHDYRNGVKPWQFDPTKWCIWLLHRLGMANDLRRVPQETILLAEIAEQQRTLQRQLNHTVARESEALRHLLQSAQDRLQSASAEWERRKADYRAAAERRVEASKERLAQLRHDLNEASGRLRKAIASWRRTHRTILTEIT